MNAQLPTTVQMYFTAKELADLAKRFELKGFPHSESGVIRLAKREGWADMPGSLRRKRAGRDGGGGWEYHISLAPRLQGLLLVERNHHNVSAARQVVVAKEQGIVAQADVKPRATALQTAEARVKILTSIIGYSARTGRKVSQGIAEFLRAQDGHSRWRAACAARDRGDYQTAEQAKLLHEGSPLEREDKFWITEEILECANDRARKSAGFCTVSERTLFRWMKDYQASGMKELAPLPTKQVEAIPDEFWQFMSHYARPAKPSVTRAHKLYVKSCPEGASPLTLSQVEYVLQKKLDHVQRNKGREGALTLRSRLAYVSRDTSDLMPTAIYVADGHTFDAEVADPASGRPMRPEITSIMDVATRRLVGWAISRKENVIAVSEALSNACAANGICAVFYVDRGAGYKNKRFDADDAGLMARLGITKMHALPYNSQAKGNIERSHQTIWIPMAQEMPTFLGAKMDKEARQATFKATRRDLREHGLSRDLMRWDEFRRAVAERAEEYNNEPHRSLPRLLDPDTGRWRHMSPNEAWAMHVADGFEPVRVDDEVMNDLFRPYEKRKVSRCLVTLHTNEYFSLDLNPFHQEWVYVGYDDNQADKVWIRKIDPATDEPGALICVAIYGGNRVGYMPRTQIEIAQDKRIRTAIKRNDEHRRAIEEERDAAYVVEHQRIEAMPFLDLSPVASEPVALVADASETASAAPAPRRRTFASDEELAAWALEHPGELTINQTRVLRDCLSNSTGRKVLEMAGIDTEALRTLLRAAA